MRRILLLASLACALVIGSSCRHDGRAMRPAGPTQNGSVSTMGPSSSLEPSFDAPSVLDTAAESSSSNVSAQGSITQGSSLLPTSSPSSNGALAVTAPWADGSAIPAQYTCDGGSVSPALSWSPAPVGTVEIGITVTDDNAAGYIHWTVAGIDATATSVSEDSVPLNAIEGVNGSDSIGYTGPCPPPGTSHIYRITVYYLDQQIELGDGAPGSDLISAIRSASLASADLTGFYSRA